MSLFGLLGLGVSAYSGYKSYQASSKQADALQSANEARNKVAILERKRNDLQANRERLRVVRDARIKRGKAFAAATRQGGALGSARGGIGSIISQGSAGLKSLNQFKDITRIQNQYYDTATIFGNQAARYGTTASTFKGLTNLGLTVFDRRKDIPSAFNQARSTLSGIFSS